MTVMPALVYPDHLEVALIHSAADLGGKSRQMVNLNGSYRTKSYDMKGMGGQARINDLGLMTMIANTKSLVLSGEPVESENLVDHDRQQRLDLDLLRAFGVEIAAMGGFVREVLGGLAEGSPLPADRKTQLRELVNEIITLKKLTSLGKAPQAAERLKTMIAATAEKIADLLKDGLDTKTFSGAIAEFTHGFLKTTAEKYGLPELTDKLALIEGRLNPQNYLAAGMAELTVRLASLLERPEVDEAAKEEIEQILERLGEHPEGEPLPRDVMLRLEALPEKLPEIQAGKFEKALERLKDANITLKAEISGLPVAEVKKIEAVINALDNIRGELLRVAAPMAPERKKLVERLERTVRALDNNPADKGAMRDIGRLGTKLSAPEIAAAVPVALTKAMVFAAGAITAMKPLQETAQTAAERAGAAAVITQGHKPPESGASMEQPAGGSDSANTQYRSDSLAVPLAADTDTDRPTISHDISHNEERAAPAETQSGPDTGTAPEPETHEAALLPPDGQSNKGGDPETVTREMSQEKPAPALEPEKEAESGPEPGIEPGVDSAKPEPEKHSADLSQLPEKQAPKSMQESMPPDCPHCREAFEKASSGTLTEKDIGRLFGSDVAKGVTVDQAREYILQSNAADRKIQDSGITAVDTGDKNYQDTIEKAIRGLETPPEISSGRDGHICNEFCRHGNPEGDRGFSPPPPASLQHAMEKSKILKKTSASKIKKSEMKFEPS